MVTVACCQLAPAVGDLEKNLAMVSRAIASASSAGADVIVLPELVTSGYCLASREEAASVSIRFDHPVFRQWSGDAGGAVLVLGFAEAGDAGCLYNSAALVDGRGLRAVYRKAHLWDAEHKFFTPGSAPPPVIDTAVGRIAMMICYDLEFPEMTRSVALAGADLLAVPTNWPWTERPDGWPAPEVVIAMAAARVNRLPSPAATAREPNAVSAGTRPASSSARTGGRWPPPGSPARRSPSSTWPPDATRLCPHATTP